MKTITATKKELITVFAQWNKEYFDSGETPTREMHNDPALAKEQADDFITYLNKLQEDK